MYLPEAVDEPETALDVWERPREPIVKEFLNAPDMIGQPSSHGRCTGMSNLFLFAQFVMRKAKIVGASNQEHPGFQGLEPTSRMSAVAREDGQAFTHCAILPQP